jgi:hypothetical protein
LYNEIQVLLSQFVPEIDHSSILTLHVWRVKTRLPERHLTLCKVLARGKMNTCLIEFEDGYRVTTSRNNVIKRETLQKRLAKRFEKGRGEYAGRYKL